LLPLPGANLPPPLLGPEKGGNTSIEIGRDLTKSNKS
jgi:hypothetical protein